MSKIRIIWKKSAIGYNRDQRNTLRALGLRRLNHSAVHADTLTIRGMINKVRHLVSVQAVVEE
ncbi:MAG: 50S ribosomal protein L30 [Dehalococcoidia bacterium]|nr:50S ribosomal protein L30 [Dehalococcoidia bacterium]